MAILGTAIWRVRTGGSNTNGGGYDPGIAGAATDYSQVTTAQATGSAGTATGTAAFSDLVAANFTAAMIGNALWIASGAGFTAGAYFITAFTDASHITLDRSPGTGTVAAWKIGGAWAGPDVNMGTPISGNIIYIYGSGTGSTASPDYTMTSVPTPNGGGANGYIKFIGWNARPYIKSSATNSAFMFINATYTYFENLYCFANGTGGGYIIQFNTSNGVANNMILDQNGNDVNGFVIANTACAIINTEIFSNSHNASLGGGYAINLSSFDTIIQNCNIHDCWGNGIHVQTGEFVDGCIIAKNSGNGIVTTAANAGIHVTHCTIDGNLGHGIVLTDTTASSTAQIAGNIISNHTGSGKAGISAASGTDIIRGFIDYNSYFNNTSDAVNLTIGTGIVNGTQLHDNIGIDPQYTAQSTENYAIGTNLKALGYPGSTLPFLQSKSGQTTGVTSYMDAGTVQRQETGGGSSSMLVHPGMTGGARG